MRIRLTPQATRDLDEAVTYYEGEAGLGDAFLDQVDTALDRLAMFPRGAPPVDGFPGVRRARLRRFPYGVFYRLDQDDLVILRVLHGARDTSGQPD